MSSNSQLHSYLANWSRSLFPVRLLNEHLCVFYFIDPEKPQWGSQLGVYLYVNQSIKQSSTYTAWCLLAEIKPCWTRVMNWMGESQKFGI